MSSKGIGSTRFAVVGHVEWIEFARVERVPLAGEIVHASETWEEVGGGGAVAAVQLALLSGDATFFTALGNDAPGRRSREELERRGARVEATFRDTPQRRGFTLIDGRGERTITVIGERLGPAGPDPLAWDRLQGCDAVYVTAGDDEAIRRSRRTRVLVATSRIIGQLARVGVPVDALVGSGRDPDERYRPGDLDPPPRLVVATSGVEGGTFAEAGQNPRHFDAAPLPGPVVDAYGCGDTFAAGLTYALGLGQAAEDAVAFAARCGAACLTGRGPYEGLARIFPRS